MLLGLLISISPKRQFIIRVPVDTLVLLTSSLLLLLPVFTETFTLALSFNVPTISIYTHSSPILMTKQVQQDQYHHDKNDNAPVWCEEKQIYINGTIASSSHAEKHIQEILSSIKNQKQEQEQEQRQDKDKDQKQKQLHIFGYGSLCWNPGSTSNQDVLAHQRVTKQIAKAIGWKRCWCQQSTDHRGNVDFYGLVCTLLHDDEIAMIEDLQRQKFYNHEDLDTIDNNIDRFKKTSKYSSSVSMTEGVLFTIPNDLVELCLEQLDFREKGGYARDVIDVVIVEQHEQEQGSQNVQSTKLKYEKALLYRGTPDNPAFSKRALFDKMYAAAIISVAKGPSGSNDEYLYNLDKFLSSTVTTVPSNEKVNNDKVEEVGDVQTKYLASLTKSLQKNHDLYFLLGSGSNQHNQLLLSNTIMDENGNVINAADLVNNGEEAHVLNDIFLIVPKQDLEPSDSQLFSHIRPKALYAGGGHSALLTDQNDLYLWGWNEYGQSNPQTASSSISIANSNIEPLNIKVSKAALGHCHTLVIEKLTNNLYCFGDDSRGQVTGRIPTALSPPSGECSLTPILLDDKEEFVDVAAGVFHSAAITKSGELITFGCSKFKQSLQSTEESKEKSNTFMRRWKLPDGGKLIKVACGRRHTVMLDEYGRVWTMGENKKYGQLGRARRGPDDENGCQYSVMPQLVDGALGKKGSGCIDIDCGWSHNVALVFNSQNNRQQLFGWGRSDKCQFGILDKTHIDTPHLIFDENGQSIKQVVCGSEFSFIQTDDGQIYSCGWNEHGNLSNGSDLDIHSFTKISGMKKIRNFYHHNDGNDSLSSKSSEVLMAAGGAHFLATMI